MHPPSGRAARRAAVPARIAFLSATAVLALVLAACSSGASEDGTADSSTATTTADGTASGEASDTTETTDAPTTTQDPTTAVDTASGQELSFSEYQETLVEQDQAVHGSLTTLAGAGSYGALAGQARQSATTVRGAADRLGEITPPDDFSAQHDAIAAGLDGFASGLSGIADRVDSQELCGSPAVLTELDTLPATGEIRAAAEAFDAAGGGRLTFLPDLVAPEVTRPGNGEHLRPQETSGQGELIVENQGVDGDVVVALESGGSAVLAVYVHANSTATVTNIGDGTYNVFYANGNDWSPTLRAFSRDCAFGRYDDTFPYETTAAQYTIWTVSLRPQIGGNAPTSPVSPEDFPA